MSPFNLDDVEDYLLRQAEYIKDAYAMKQMQQWIRDRFQELATREKAILDA